VRAVEIAPLAAARASDEYQGLVAYDDASRVLGVALFGMIAGSVGTGALYAIAVAPDASRRGVGTLLVRQVVQTLGAAGARLVVAEWPDDERVAPVASLLAGAEFTEVGRVPDLVRDDVALRLWRATPKGNSSGAHADS